LKFGLAVTVMIGNLVVVFLLWTIESN